MGVTYSNKVLEMLNVFGPNVATVSYDQQTPLYCSDDYITG